MSKGMEYQQQHVYPTQMPSAPPSYAEAMHHGNAPPAMGFVVEPVPANSYRAPPQIIEVQRTIVSLPLGPSPSRIKCPHCLAEIITVIDSEPSCAAHLCCLLLLLIGCCPFSSLPYCMDSLKNIRHSCPNCKMFLGNYQP